MVQSENVPVRKFGHQSLFIPATRNNELRSSIYEGMRTEMRIRKNNIMLIHRMIMRLRQTHFLLCLISLSAVLSESHLRYGTHISSGDHEISNDKLEQEHNIENVNRRELATEELAPLGRHPRVKVYTFYHGIDHIRESEGNNHDHILDTWKSIWWEMGWDPKILTLDDAKQHPRFEEFNKELDKFPLAGGSGVMAEYNRMCFLRWLAMSHIGGGWFADFDTVPLRPPQKDDEALGHTEKFHLYHRFRVPSLVSGSRQEWERMAFLLLSTGLDYPEHLELPLWSDMMALQYTVDNDICDCELSNQVSEGRYFLNGHPITPGECWIYHKDRAAHFSHDAMRFGDLNVITYEDHKYYEREGKYANKRTINDRHDIMKAWFSMYKNQCLQELL